MDSRGVYIELTSLISADSHVVPGGSLLVLLDDRLDMWLEVADVLSNEESETVPQRISVGHTSLAGTHSSFCKSL